VELIGIVSVSSEDARAGPEDEREGEPETAERRERGGTEGVTSSKLPHASEELDKTTDTNGHANNEIGSSNASGTNVEEREDQGGRCEREQSKGCRVSELPVVDGETGLREVDAAGAMSPTNAEGSIAANMREVVGLKFSIIVARHWLWRDGGED